MNIGALARTVLLGPGFVAKAAARRASAPEEAWMLCQRREVRESFVREVVDRGDETVHAEIWMLRQSRDVRESYIRDVLRHKS
jgi:hypothetical protein